MSPHPYDAREGPASQGMNSWCVARTPESIVYTVTPCPVPGALALPNLQHWYMPNFYGMSGLDTL